MRSLLLIYLAFDASRPMTARFARDHRIEGEPEAGHTRYPFGGMPIAGRARRPCETARASVWADTGAPARTRRLIQTPTRAPIGAPIGACERDA